MLRKDVPPFVEPPTIQEMSDEQLDKFIADIRERRMVIVAIHTQAENIKRMAKTAKLQDKAGKLAIKVAKHINKIDKLFEETEGLIGQMRTLRMQAIQDEDMDV